MIQTHNFKSEGEEKKYFVHLSKIVDCLDLENIFQFQKNGNNFNFHQYYEAPDKVDLEVFKKQVQKKISYVWTQSDAWSVGEIWNYEFVWKLKLFYLQSQDLSLFIIY